MKEEKTSLSLVHLKSSSTHIESPMSLDLIYTPYISINRLDIFTVTPKKGHGCGAVGKISAYRPQGHQFDCRLCRDLNLYVTSFSVSAFHLSGEGK